MQVCLAWHLVLAACFRLLCRHTSWLLLNIQVRQARLIWVIVFLHTCVAQLGLVRHLR